MFEDVYRTRQRHPWRDIMQVCLKAHVINDGVQKYPEYNKDFCDSCGAKTITNCPNCNNLIPGDMQDTGVIVAGFRQSAPDFCQNCGEPFPWTNQKEAKRLEAEAEKSIEILERVFEKFHSVARQLRNRHDNRATLDITDEYDVQDLLYTLLILYFDDIRLEEWTPSYAGKAARMDLLLKEEKIVVEVKMTRKGLGDKELGDQLIIDIERYKIHPDCNTLICFIYDPEGRITNPRGLTKDLASQSKDNMRVIIFINPR